MGDYGMLSNTIRELDPRSHQTPRRVLIFLPENGKRLYSYGRCTACLQCLFSVILAFPAVKTIHRGIEQ